MYRKLIKAQSSFSEDIFRQSEDDPTLPKGTDGRCRRYVQHHGLGVPEGRGMGTSNAMTVRKIFSACAGAAIYRQEVFEEIGYFDEMHFAYLEDIDVGYRAKIAGYYSLYCRPQGVSM